MTSPRDGWESVVQHRPVVYYAPGQGVEAVRARLLGVLAFIMGDAADCAPDDSADWCRGSERTAVLDPAVWSAVVPRVWIADSLPGGPDPIGVFLRDLEGILRDVAACMGHVPLVLIDDLETLLRVVGGEDAIEAARVITGINGTLVRCGSAGLAAAYPERATLHQPAGTAAIEGLVPLGHGLLELVSRSPVRVDLAIRENPHATWRGTLPLVLHSSAGMVTLAR